MPTYLYGLILSHNATRIGDGSDDWMTGIEGGRLRAIACGSLAALVSDVERVPSRSSLDDIRAHDAALRAVVASGVTVVASRFGQLFADDADACRDIAQHASRVERLLGEYDGCVEMRVLLAQAGGDSEPAATETVAAESEFAPGRAYLEQLRARAALAAERLPRISLAEALGPMVRRERVELLANEAGVVVSHLIPRDRESAYRASVAELPALSGARVIGPLPLYGFSDE